MLRELQRQAIVALVKVCKWGPTKAAAALGVSESTAFRVLKEAREVETARKEEIAEAAKAMKGARKAPKRPRPAACEVCGVVPVQGMCNCVPVVEEEVPPGPSPEAMARAKAHHDGDERRRL